jgi:DnaK suppressor protein
MNKEQKIEIEALINKEINTTLNQIEEYKELSKPIEPDCAIGRVSRMDAINNKSINEAALRSSKEKLKSLEYVLTKLNSPDFGNCARCKNPIPLKRIVLRPQTVFCVHCAH